MKLKFNIRKLLKILGIILGGLIILIILIIFSLRIPAVQNYVKDKAIVFLEDKIETDVSLEKIYITFPNRIIIQNLHLHGQETDTLLWVQDLDVGLNMWKLLDSKADFTSIRLDGTRAHVVRNEEGIFNFDYIIDAFATEEEKDPSKPFIISLDKIKLKDIGITFTDLQARNDIEVYFRYFDTRVREFDLDNNSYAVNHIELDGLRLNLKQELLEEVAQEVEETVDSLSQNNSFSIDLNNIKFTDFNVNYDDENTRTFAKIIFEELNVEIDEIDLQNQHYEIENLRLSNADISADLLLISENSEEVETESTDNPITVLLNKMKLENVKLVYNNTSVAVSNEGIDFNHLDFSQINIHLEDFEMRNNEFSGNLVSAEIQEKSGLHIQEFKTEFTYSSQQAFLKNLYLQTPRTLLRDQIVLTYDTMDELNDDLGNVHIAADIENSKIGFSDILTIMPDLRRIDVFRNYPNAILNVHTSMSGIVNDLFIHHLDISGLDRLQLNARGNIKNAMNPDFLAFDLDIQEFSTSSPTIYKIIPPATIPSNISLPSYFKIQGDARGTTDVINTHLNLTSTFGNAELQADLDMRNQNQEIYDIQANLQNFDIGRIMQNQELGKITAQISAQGQSFDFERATADLNGNVNYVEYNNYRYQNLDLTGNIENGNYLVELYSQDPNADLNLIASGVYDENNPTLKLFGNINKLDINSLGFYDSPMIFVGEINANFKSLDPDNLNGNLQLQNFAFSDRKEVFPIQDLVLTAESTIDSTKISLNSQVADIDIIGNYKPTEIFTALLKSINNYYEFQETEKEMNISPGQFFTLNASIKNDDLIRKFVPDLENFETVHITGNYNADTNNIELDAEIPRVHYGSILLENAALNIENEKNALQYNFNIASLQNESFSLDRLNLNGEISDNIIHYNLTTLNSDETEEYRIAGMLRNLDDFIEISLNSDGLILNQTQWNVAENNFIRFGDNGVFADNFRISNANSEILIHSETNSPNSPLNIDFQNFKIEDITEIIKKDSLLARGNINGNIQLRNLMENPLFDADLNLTEIEIFGNPVGDLSAELDSDAQNIINANLVLSGNENDVNITGNFNTETSTFDLKMNVNALQMQSLQGFTMNQLTDSEGYLSGDLELSGTTDAPRILGDLIFNDVGFIITQTGSDFRNINDEINFTNRGIEFTDFRINDDAGNFLSIDGQVLTDNYQDFAFNLDLNADDFSVVDSEESAEAIMYGVLEVDAALQIRGDLNLPVVDGSITISDDTDFVFVLPQSAPSLQEREGIVEFVDRDQVVLNETLEEETLDSQIQLTGMDVNVNIELNREAKLSIIVDKVNGDFVELQGEAQLTGGIDPSGKSTLVGVFQVEEGGYELSVSVLKRRFDIQKGSTITWTGEPMDATLDLTAIYTTEAAPLDLLEQQLTGLPQAEMNLYKQRIPFHTLLQLEGELMKPVITFDITTDESNVSVSSSVLDNTEAKLAQLRTEESEMNKQVFALLLLNRFVGENPFESSTGISAGTMARQSVSKILSQQLNNLTSDLIAGVDLNFDLESSEDYSMGERNTRTDLNVELSKRLLDDRLKVSVGSNFGIEGDARQNEETTNIAGDVTLDYSLSRDGRYMLRAYRKDEYQVALQGQIIETGVGFIITLDYDKFRDIFRSSKNRNRSED